METHLRLDRGVYGGVGFSRDLSLRKSGERWHEMKTPTSRVITGKSELSVILNLLPRREFKSPRT